MPNEELKEGEVIIKPLPSVAQKVLSTLYQEVDALVEEFLKPFGVIKGKK